jgi:hypothetical protein
VPTVLLTALRTSRLLLVAREGGEGSEEMYRTRHKLSAESGEGGSGGSTVPITPNLSSWSYLLQLKLIRRAGGQGTLHCTTV